MPLTALFAGIAQCYDLEVFQHLLQQEIKRSLRYSEFFALLLCSVDERHPQTWDDDGGRSDRLLATVVDNVRQELRETDFLGLYGNTVGVVLPRAGARDVRIVGDRIRERIGRFAFPAELAPGGPHQTVSLGGACFPTDGRDLPGLLQCSFLALRQAREAGGDRLVMFSELEGQA